MSKLDDKDLKEIAAGGEHSITPEGSGDGDAPEHGSVKDSAPTPGGSIGPDSGGGGGGSSDVGQG